VTYQRAVRGAAAAAALLWLGPCARRSAWKAAGPAFGARMRLAGIATGVGVLVPFLRPFLMCDRSYTLADAVLPVGQFAFASADGVTDVLTPCLRIGTAGDRCSSKHCRRHQADRSSDHDHGDPGGAAPRPARNPGVRAYAIWSADRRWRRTKACVALVQLVLQPEVELVVHRLLT